MSHWPTSPLPETIQKEGGFEAHIPNLPLDFRCEVPTRLCLTRAGTLAGLGTRQAGEPPIARAPKDPVTDKVPGEHSHRALGRAFSPSPPSGPPTLRLHSRVRCWEEASQEGAQWDRGPVSVSVPRTGSVLPGWNLAAAGMCVHGSTSSDKLCLDRRQEGGWKAGSLKGPGGVSRAGGRLHVEGVEFLDEWPIVLHKVGWPNATSTKQPP